MTRDFLLANFQLRALLSWPVFLLSLGWAITTNMTDVLNNPEGMYLERVGSVVAAHLVLFMALIGLVRLLETLPPLAQSALMIPAIVVLSLFRGLVVWLFLTGLGVDSPEMFNYRFFASVATVGLPLALMGIIVHRIRSYTGTRARLLAENERLIELQNTARDNIRQVAQSRLEQIRAVILGALAGPTSNTEEVIDAINHSVDTVLLPQIAELEAESGPSLPEKLDLARTKIDFGEALRNAFAPQHLHGVAVGLCILVTAAFTIIRNHTLADAASLLVMAVVLPIVLLSLLKRLLEKIPPATPPALVGAVFVFGVLVSGFLTGAATLPFSLDSEKPLSLFFQAPLFVTLLTLLFALASSTQVQALAANARLAETTDRLAWEVARVAAEHRQVRRTLAHTLHGPLQAGLLSSVLRLQQAAKDTSESVASQVAAIRSELQDLVESLQITDPTDAPPLEAIMANVAKTWAKVATVDLRVTDSMTSTIESDPQVMRALSELIPELVFNSVKHGEATGVSIEVAEAGPDTVTLTCTDNGTRPPQSSRVGLGTKLLDEYALRWDRVVEGGHTITTLVLPIAPLP